MQVPFVFHFIKALFHDFCVTHVFVFHIQMLNSVAIKSCKNTFHIFYTFVVLFVECEQQHEPADERSQSCVG